MVTVSITGCARCHGPGHEDLAFAPLAHGVDVEDPHGPLTHWAPCPANGEPILLRYVPPGTEREHPVDADHTAT